MIRFTVVVLVLIAPAMAEAGFFRDLKRAVQNTAEQTVIMVASDMVRDMIIDATSMQTSTEAEVAEEYESENGALPSTMTVSSYRSLILPGDAVKPGTKVRVKSYIEVVPGQDGRRAKIEEKLTIWDNEDNSESLKTMLKEAGDTGGIYEGEFVFSLPEGMPQGVYPITTSLLMDGEWVRDEKHNLQLVMVASPSGECSPLSNLAEVSTALTITTKEGGIHGRLRTESSIGACCGCHGVCDRRALVLTATRRQHVDGRGGTHCGTGQRR